MKRLFWDCISLGGTLAAGLLLVVLAFVLDVHFGLVALLNLAVITALSNIYKVYRFKPRPDNPKGIRPMLTFNPRKVWLLLHPRRAMEYFHYVDAGSMPSIHSARSFNQAALFVLYLNTPLAIPLYLLAALIAWSRVVKLRHDQYDISVGATIGVVCAALSTFIL